MGNNRPPVEKKRRKKGRPSLLDLQKRTLKQQQQLHRNPSSIPIPIPYLRSPASGRRSTRRNPDPGDDDDDDDGGNRREKKLKLVLRLPERSAGSPSGSDSEAELQNRGIGGGNRDKAEECDFSKGTDAVQGEPSVSGPTTPLPDKKLLLFILDRLQKKDTYGVFSEPVDPEELPDYHEVIEHPMDFGTVRKNLSSGVYANLEQFENDVFLISSNAMRYNASDTIYFRQARSIHELAKKSFENLRQESDDNEPEPKIAPRRGRPPTKNTIKRPVGRLPVERAAADFSDATLAKAGDGNWSNLNHGLLSKGSASDKPGSIGISTRASLGRNSEKLGWTCEHKVEKHEEYSGSALKGIPMRYGKKPIVIDENRRNTYKQPQLSTCVHEPPILTTFDGEKQQLVPVGLQTEHAYARSLARFAANLGPIGRTIAAKKIERALPPGMKFGQGWVGNSRAPQQSQPPLLSTSNSEALQQSQLPLLSPSTAPRHSFSLPKVSPCNTVSGGDKLPPGLEPPSNDSAVEEGCSKPLPRASASATLNRSSDSTEVTDPSTEVTDPNKGSKFEAVSNLLSGDTGNSNQSKAPFQLQRNPSMQPSANGFSAQFGFSLASQLANMVSPPTPSGPFSMEIPMTHARALDMVSRGNSFIHQTPMDHSDVERAKLAGSLGTLSFNGPTKDPGHDSQGTWWGLSLQPKPVSILPDSNAQSQSPGSPVSGVVVDAQQPDDLALQL